MAVITCLSLPPRADARGGGGGSQPRVATALDAVLGRQGELLDHLDSWAGIDRWFDFLVRHQIEQQARGGCPIGSLAGQLAESDPPARAAIAAGLERWEGHLRDGLIRMKTRGKLRNEIGRASCRERV